MIKEISIYFVLILLLISVIANGALTFIILKLIKLLDIKYRVINEQNARLKEYERENTIENTVH